MTSSRHALLPQGVQDDPARASELDASGERLRVADEAGGLHTGAATRRRARRMRRAATRARALPGRAVQQLQQRLGVLVDERRADALDREQLAARPGPAAHDLAQRRVGRDRVGGLAVGALAAPRLQRLELGVGDRRARRRRRRAARPRRLAADGDRRQPVAAGRARRSSGPRRAGRRVAEVVEELAAAAALAAGRVALDRAVGLPAAVRRGAAQLRRRWRGRGRGRSSSTRMRPPAPGRELQRAGALGDGQRDAVAVVARRRARPRRSLRARARSRATSARDLLDASPRPRG